MSPVTLELLGGAVDVAGKDRWQVAALLIGNNVAKYVERSRRSEHPRSIWPKAPLGSYDTEAYTEIVARAIEAHMPWALLISAHSNGRTMRRVSRPAWVWALPGDAVGLTGC